MSEDPTCRLLGPVDPIPLCMEVLWGNGGEMTVVGCDEVVDPGEILLVCRG